MDFGDQHLCLRGSPLGAPCMRARGLHPLGVCCGSGAGPRGPREPFTRQPASSGLRSGCAGLPREPRCVLRLLHVDSGSRHDRTAALPELSSRGVSGPGGGSSSRPGGSPDTGGLLPVRPHGRSARAWGSQPSLTGGPRPQDVCRRAASMSPFC